MTLTTTPHLNFDGDARAAHAPELQRDVITLPARHTALLDDMKAEHDCMLAAAAGVDPLMVDAHTDWTSTAVVQRVLQAAAEKEAQLPGTQKQLMRTYAAAGAIRQTAVTLHQYGIRWSSQV